MVGCVCGCGVVEAIVEGEQAQGRRVWHIFVGRLRPPRSAGFRAAASERQADYNAAELWGGVQVLRLVPWPTLAIVSDSQYLIIVAKGEVQQWHGMAWVGGGGGHISNIPLWEELLEEIVRLGKELRWIYVRGHAGMEGTETAHRLPVEGMGLRGMWAQSCTSFATWLGGQHLAHRSIHRNHRGIAYILVLEMELQCENLGSIWLLLGLIEMSEPDTEEDCLSPNDRGTYAGTRLPRIWGRSFVRFLVSLCTTARRLTRIKVCQPQSTYLCSANVPPTMHTRAAFAPWGRPLPRRCAVHSGTPRRSLTGLSALDGGRGAPDVQVVRSPGLGRTFWP